MKNWYAAHLILYVELKDQAQRTFPVWENIVLIQAQREDEAFEKAARRGKHDEGDDDGSFRWEGKPARWVFAGVRKLTLCEDPEKRPGDGTEVSYIEMEVDSAQAVSKLVRGDAVSVKYAEEFSQAER